MLEKLASSMPNGEQVAQSLQLLRCRGARSEVVEGAESGQHGSIHAVRLGEVADGLGEAPRAQRVDQDRLHAGVKEALVEWAVIAAGGFEDGPLDAVLAQPVAQGPAAGRVVVELAVVFGVQEMGVELGLADVNACDYGG